MNQQEPHDERLETALRGLPLRKPSRVLDHRVEQTMVRRRSHWRGYAAAACFGGICFAAGLLLGRQDNVNNESTPGRLGEVKEQTPTNSDEAGPRLVSGPTQIDAQWPIAQSQFSYNIDAGPPIRATVQDTIERTRWVDPENNRDIELIRPVREVTLTRQNPY